MRPALLVPALIGGTGCLLVALSTRAHPVGPVPVTHEGDTDPAVTDPSPGGELATRDDPARSGPWMVERTVEGPPVSLTASDGSGLAIASLRASAVIEGPLAYTEVKLAFDNPENRVREGTFKMVLPQGASLGRFAMKIEGAWQEGEVVPKERARVAYEDALHRNQDPALLERGAGNEFTARVFPIPPRGRKEIVIGYGQEIVAGAPYALPLRGLPELGELDVSVGGEGVSPRRMHEERFVPAQDFVLEGTGAPRRGPEAIRAGHLVVARVRPVAEALPEPVERAVVLIDTSASRALGLGAELRSVQALLHGLAARRGGELPVSVAAFDQEVAPVYEGDASRFGQAEIDRITSRRALGASNLEKALSWANGEAKRTGATRVVLVTDAVPTAGEDDASKLATAAAALKEGGVQRLDVVAVGGLRDDALARKLVAAGLAHDGVVVPATDGAAAMARRLEAGTRSDVAVSVDGATWSYPTRLDGVQPGDEVLVYAEVASGSPVRVKVAGGEPRVLDAVPVERPLVERAWAQAKIASLEEQERDHGKSLELENAIVALSTGHRVLSAYTALLVLETDQDYARFHIDRRALADILTVTDGRLAWTRRGELAPFASKIAADRREAVLARGPVAPGAENAGGTGTRAKEEEGSMGNPRADATKRPAPPRDGLMDSEAESFGMGALHANATVSAPAPAARPAAPAGFAGLQGLSGSGEGGGGTGRGMALAPARSTRAATAPAAVAQDKAGPEPFTGQFKQVKDRLARGDTAGALEVASSWQASAPGDVLALVALGESSEASADATTAARAYGSIIDLFASRADLRRFAGERLEHVKGKAASDLAIDTFDKARRDRPDHPASHRLAAFARVRRGEYAVAFEILVAGLAQRYPPGRFAGVDQILREDLGLVAAAWMKAEPGRKSDVLARLRSAGGTVEDAPSIRFVLNWETDANDVDFHVHDAQGGHAFYGARHLPSGGDLYADVTTGYGPECFTVRLPRGERATPYKLQAHYFSRGPMGYGMGKLEIIDHDGHGGLTFEERPFVVMVDHAFVDLGTVK